MKLPSFVARPLTRLSATRGGARVYKWLLPRLDPVVLRLTRGRQNFTSLVLPTFMLTSVGRRSGQPRQQPLIYTEVDGGWAVVGTNWGGQAHPAWTHNLLANPEASVLIDGVETPVRARLTQGDERRSIYAGFEAMSPNYTAYLDWAGDREVRVFVLERVD